MILHRTPKTVGFSGDALDAHIRAQRQNAPLLRALEERADRYLQSDPPTVTKRRIRAPSGDPHDYASLGPYWWPDPAKPDGIPYIRRDGEVNPAAKDPITFDGFIFEVSELTAAALYATNGKDRLYAERAVRDLCVFFLDPSTQMHPHLEYGQAIPGICHGRGIGLIETRNSWALFDAIGILDALDVLPSDVSAGVRSWYRTFLDWMLTSENGADENAAHNNHGTWYDVQIAATALFLDRPRLAADRFRSAYDRRLLRQILPNGKQPFELARTDALGYSSMNLLAWILLAGMAKRAKAPVDYFKTAPEGYPAPPLFLAFAYLLPYADDVSSFPYSNIHGTTIPSEICRLAALLAGEYPDARFPLASGKPLSAPAGSSPVFPAGTVPEPSVSRLSAADSSATPFSSAPYGRTLADIAAQYAKDSMLWRLFPLT